MIDLIFGYVLDNVQSSLNMKFGTNQSIGSAVIGPGLFEIFIAHFFTFQEDLTGNSTGYNSVNFEDRDLKLVLNERVRKILSEYDLKSPESQAKDKAPWLPPDHFLSRSNLAIK